jgi:hypothetical protein
MTATYTIDSAPFRTYRYVGNAVTVDPKRHDQGVALVRGTANLDYHSFESDILVAVVPEYKPNSLWLALVYLIHPGDGDEHAYFLAR